MGAVEPIGLCSIRTQDQLELYQTDPIDFHRKFESAQTLACIPVEELMNIARAIAGYGQFMQFPTPLLKKDILPLL
jgi:hypothetical protein